LELVIELTKCVKINELNQLECVEPIVKFEIYLINNTVRFYFEIILKDILLHSLHLCEDKFTKLGLQAKFQDQLDEDIKKHSDAIRAYFERIKFIFTQQSAENLVETYKTQINSMIIKTNKTIIATQNPLLKTTTQASGNNNNNDPAVAMPFYQCLLGMIEALIEHSFTNGSYKLEK
jgi:hypothetical protein